MRLLVVLLAVLLVILQYRLWLADNGLPRVWQLERALAEQKVENAKLRERNTTLAAEVRDLKRGLDAIEERARNELGMIRRGETFYQVVDEPLGPR